MKFLYRIVSVLMVAVILFYCAGLNTYAVQNSETSYFLSEKNIVSASKMMDFLKPAIFLYELIFGRKFIDVEIDDSNALELCNYIKENSELDIVGILQKIPVKSNGLELFYKLSDTDTTAIRNSIYSLRDKANANNNSSLALVLYIFGAYMSVIESAEVYSVPYGDDGSKRIVLKVYFIDGNFEEIHTDIYLSDDGYAYGPDEKGIQLLGFECSVYDLMIYATVNSWMRDFGFCFLYDLFSYTTPFYNYITRRYKFDYDGKEWMIQAWKGNYLFTNGAEVGIYNREEGNIGTFYKCYDSQMNMTLKLSAGDNVIFDIQKEHWWINGFKLSENLYEPSSLTLECSIEFPEDSMAQAFAESVKNQYRKDSSYEIQNNVVTVIW